MKKGARKTAKKSAKKGAKRSSARARRVVVDPDYIPPRFGRLALDAFRAGVQKEYRRMASHGVETVVIEDGRLVAGVPHKKNSVFVIGRDKG